MRFESITCPISVVSELMRTAAADTWIDSVTMPGFISKSRRAVCPTSSLT
jgi:hypothetical protein